jgi:hypothetical protein
MTKHHFGLLDMLKKSVLNFSISTSKIHLAEVQSSLVYIPHMQRGITRIDFGSDLV